MPDQILTQTVEAPTTSSLTTQVTPPQAEIIQTTVEPSTDDIVLRVTAKPVVKPQDTSGTFKEFDDITDPALKQRMIDKSKALQADYTRKTQEVARERETVQNQLKEMENWTPDKVQNYLLKNPSFLQSAKLIAEQPQANTWDVPDADKNQLLEMNRQITELRQQNFSAAMNQKDAYLQTKYGDYDSLKVNEGIANLSRTNPVDIREHVYKSIFHDEHVKAAFEMGRKEGQGLNQQRTQAVTTATGSNITPSQNRIVKEKGENDQALLSRILMNNIARSRETTAIRR